MPSIALPFAERLAGSWPAVTGVRVSGGMLLALAALLYLFAAVSVTASARPDSAAHARTAASSGAGSAALPPAPEPLAFRAVAPQDAAAINAAIPVSLSPNPAARPFVFRPSSIEDRARALACLTAAVYHEAATEGADGQRAVAQVVLNRVRHPAYPDSVCGVVFQGAERSTGCQFTFTCDGALLRAPSRSYWRQAETVAEAALAGKVFAPVGWSTHYHTNWVVPYWSAALTKAANVGSHIFYRWEGGWGRGPAFAARHAGAEPLLAKMVHLGFVLPAVAGETVAVADAAGGGGAPAPTIPSEFTRVPAVAYDPGTLNRAIVRRFEPVRREGVAETLAKQTRPGGRVDDETHWALTGERAPREAVAAAPPPATPAS